MVLMGFMGHAQWKANPNDTSLTFFCPECPSNVKTLHVSPQEFHLGDAIRLDIRYLNYQSEEVLSYRGVELDGTDKDRYMEFIWFITNVYGWVELLVYCEDMCYTYVVPTVQAYNAEKFRAY